MKVWVSAKLRFSFPLLTLALCSFPLPMPYSLVWEDCRSPFNVLYSRKSLKSIVRLNNVRRNLKQPKEHGEVSSNITSSLVGCASVYALYCLRASTSSSLLQRKDVALLQLKSTITRWREIGKRFNKNILLRYRSVFFLSSFITVTPVLVRNIH